MPHGGGSILKQPDRYGSTGYRLYLNELDKLRVGHINLPLRSLPTSSSSRERSFSQLILLICRVFYHPSLIEKSSNQRWEYNTLGCPRSQLTNLVDNQSPNINPHVIHNSSNQNSPI
ncbi:hypothetical protein KY284_001513 [Solanum tuberosum]|nr:hypothetical protein KY284_001513 [Solanum tuberosum]